MDRADVVIVFGDDSLARSDRRGRMSELNLRTRFARGCLRSTRFPVRPFVSPASGDDQGYGCDWRDDGIRHPWRSRLT
jgi:hypothetical protein